MSPTSEADLSVIEDEVVQGVGRQRQRFLEYSQRSIFLRMPQISNSNLLFVFASLFAIAFAQHCRPVRYMPVGDSITDIVCWRAYLWERLQSTGYANVNFVGSNRGENPAGCDVPSYDKDCEGHSGYLATHIVALNLLPSWLEKNPTDIVTIHLGSNDISHGYTASAILDAFTRLVEQMRDHNSHMKIIVSNRAENTFA